MSHQRAQPGITITMPTPVIVGGKPLSPTYQAIPDLTFQATRGPRHIRSSEPPTPKPKPRKNGHPPGGYDSDGGDWAARWSVDNLPDPSAYADGFYWLGTPSAADGTSHIQQGARQWGPCDGTPNAPSWHSRYPFKPSVTSATHYLFGGDTVHHPKGVNFNAHFIEHMWMDFGRERRQPFTWLIAAMPTDFPSSTYTHHLLDAGRNPSDVGFPQLSASDVIDDHKIKDDLDYRTMLTVSSTHVRACARLNAKGPATVRCRVPGGLRPKMFIAVFNGDHSFIGQYSPGVRELQRGELDNTADQHHRFYVLGRRYGVISHRAASHMLVFEMRYWGKALSKAELAEQYDQLASRHQFEKYRVH